MQPTFPEEAKSLISKIYLKRIKKYMYKIWREIKVLINKNTQTKYAPIYKQKTQL